MATQIIASSCGAHSSSVDLIESARRRTAGLQASYQLDSMIGMLGREARQDSFDLLLKACLPRMSELAMITMAALGGDDHHSTSNMEAALGLEVANHG